MIDFIDKLLGISEKYQEEIDSLNYQNRHLRAQSNEILASTTLTKKQNKHLRKGLEKLYRESTKLGHIRKEKVQLMCMEALQVPKSLDNAAAKGRARSGKEANQLCQSRNHMGWVEV